MISIVILNYNGSAFILNCLKTVLGSNYPSFEVILVDNGSEDDGVELVKRVFGNDQRLKIICNKKNFGFAKGNNIGLTHSRGDIIVFLNNDTEADSNWLRELANVFTSYNDVGVAQCMLVQMKDRRSIQSTGSYLVPSIGWPVPRPRARIESNMPPNILACGAALAIRRSVVDEVGGFDQDYFINFEDVDLSLRVWLSGYRVVLAQNSIVYHMDPTMHSSSYVKGHRFLREFHSSKNVVVTLLKNFESKIIVKYLPTVLTFTLFRGLYFSIKLRDSSIFLATIEGLSWSVFNIQKILRKRHIVQKRIRKVSDDYVLKRICLCAHQTIKSTKN